MLETIHEGEMFSGSFHTKSDQLVNLTIKRLRPEVQKVKQEVKQQ